MRSRKTPQQHMNGERKILFHMHFILGYHMNLIGKRERKNVVHVVRYIPTTKLESVSTSCKFIKRLVAFSRLIIYWHGTCMQRFLFLDGIC